MIEVRVVVIEILVWSCSKLEQEGILVKGVKLGQASTLRGKWRISKSMSIKYSIKILTREALDALIQVPPNFLHGLPCPLRPAPT